MYTVPHLYAYPAPVPTNMVPAAPVTTVPPTRQYANHQNSSAFSSSANPDEDWTKISDLAERRRIQNRIAQRNYRKKLKRRLEDLERRAGTSQVSPGDGNNGSCKIGISGSGRRGGNGKAPRSKKPQPTLSSLSKQFEEQRLKEEQQKQHHQEEQHQHGDQMSRHTSPFPPPLSHGYSHSRSPSQHLYVPSTKPHHTSHHQQQFTPPLQADDEMMFGQAPPSFATDHHRAHHRERSHTPPSMYTAAYSTYPSVATVASTAAAPSQAAGGASTGADDMLVNVAAAAAAVATPTTSSVAATTTTSGVYDYSWTTGMAPSVSSMGLPSLSHTSHHHQSHHNHHSHHSQPHQHHFLSPNSSMKGQDSAAAAAAAAAAITTSMPPYMGYPFMPTAMDTSNPYDSHPHTPPLSHSYDHSTTCSDAGYDYPTTPLSMASPGVAA